MSEQLDPAHFDDILELDEVCSYVKKRRNKVWTWTALSRRTRQIIAFVNGDRSEKTCRKLWQKIPETYRACFSFSDFWQAYAKVFSEQTHQCVGKDSGQTNHMERWNNTLRQRLGRLTRKTLSFSKDEAWHENVIHWFIISYNSSLSFKS